MFSNKTPLGRHYSAFVTDVALIRRDLKAERWIQEHKDEIAAKLRPVDEKLSNKVSFLWEAGPVPLGRRAIDLEGMCLCRLVDSFQLLLAKYVGEIFRLRPETLRAGECEPVDVTFVLECHSIDEFRQRLADRMLRRLGRFSEMKKFLKNKLGINITLTKETERRVTAAIALRNIQVHSASRADEQFLTLTGRTDVAIGEFVRVSPKDLSDAMEHLARAAEAFRRAIGQKFRGLG